MVSDILPVPATRKMTRREFLWLSSMAAAGLVAVQAGSHGVDQKRKIFRAAGEIVDIPSLPTLSDATAGGIEAGSITFGLCRDHVDRWERVGEDEIAAAIRFLHDREDLVVEGGAALGAAVMLGRPEHLMGKTVAIVVSGSKIDEAVLEEILSR